MSNVPLFYPTYESDKEHWGRLNCGPIIGVRLAIFPRKMTARADYGRFKPHIYFRAGKWQWDIERPKNAEFDYSAMARSAFAAAFCKDHS